MKRGPRDGSLTIELFGMLLLFLSCMLFLLSVTAHGTEDLPVSSLIVGTACGIAIILAFLRFHRLAMSLLMTNAVLLLALLFVDVGFEVMTITLFLLFAINYFAIGLLPKRIDRDEDKGNL